MEAGEGGRPAASGEYDDADADDDVDKDHVQKKNGPSCSSSIDDQHSHHHHHHQNPFVGQRRAFLFTLISHGFFLVASSLYLYLAVLQYLYERMVRYYPDEVLQADDDAVWAAYGYEDDYVLQAPLTDRWISRYTVVYFTAALCFVGAGMVDYYQWRDWFGGGMMAAAAFGVASACYGETNLARSEQLNAVSVHLWLLDALALLWTTNRHRHHHQRGGRLYHVLRLAVLAFVVATFLDVVLSWLYIISVMRQADQTLVRVGLPVSKTELVASTLWLLSAIVYLVVTLILGGQAAAIDEHQLVAQLAQRSTPSMTQKVGLAVTSATTIITIDDITSKDDTSKDEDDNDVGDHPNVFDDQSIHV